VTIGRSIKETRRNKWVSEGRPTGPRGPFGGGKTGRGSARTSLAMGRIGGWSGYVSP